jgi:hypothetical protein
VVYLCLNAGDFLLFRLDFDFLFPLWTVGVGGRGGVALLGELALKVLNQLGTVEILDGLPRVVRTFVRREQE